MRAVIHLLKLKQCDFLSDWCFLHVYDKRTNFKQNQSYASCFAQVLSKTATRGFLHVFEKQASFKQIYSYPGCFQKDSTKTTHWYVLHALNKTREFMQIYSCERWFPQVLAQSERFLLKLMFSARFVTKQANKGYFKAVPCFAEVLAQTLRPLVKLMRSKRILPNKPNAQLCRAVLPHFHITRRINVFCTFLTKQASLVKIAVKQAVLPKF